MKLFNYLFYVVLFVGFFLPTNNDMYIPLPGVLLKVNELAFLLLPIVNHFGTYRVFKINKNLSKIIVLYLAFVFFTEFILKPVAFSQSIGDSLKSFRYGLPLYSALFLLYVGVRANIRIVWNVLLIAIGSSILLSFLSLFVNIPIYYNMDDESVLTMFAGRVRNSNASFGVIGLYLLFKDKEQWYNKGRLVKYVSILSVLALVITFNRTYLTLLVLEFLYLSYKTFSVKTLFKIVLYPLILFSVAFYLYNSFDIIQRQIDKRILSIVYQETTLVESTIESSRDKIYEGIEDRLIEGYWMVGLPFDLEIFKSYHPIEGEYNASKTDISMINVLLRYGIVPLLLFLSLFYRIYKKGYIPPIILIMYFIASLNTDALFNQNSIFFFIIFIFIYTANNSHVLGYKNTV